MQLKIHIDNLTVTPLSFSLSKQNPYLICPSPDEDEFQEETHYSKLTIVNPFSFCDNNLGAP